MKQKFDARRNYSETKKAVGYLPRMKAKQKDYDRIGFMSGLEVHQQLKTKEKLFCHCPAGQFQKLDEYDAELIRHMRPTLSELGEYDGTALMEFRTRKNIVYHIKNETACTYEVDDTPPFPLNREALDIALEISLLSKLNIVGEVHITRKQYLDGSIPTGFQRTAIIGVEGEIQLSNKKVKLIQLSIEEDSCREVSDIGHYRVYRTDRLGMPLIETVTYPEFVNPDEVKEGADYIRFLNRSTGKVRTGIGSTRADVNVSCKGGTRVEIKGVAHNAWMPELTHNEALRKWALLLIRDQLTKEIKETGKWKISSKEILLSDFSFIRGAITAHDPESVKIYAVNLPSFQGILSHFTQPGQMFADEISGRLKVVACIENPNMVHSEMPGVGIGGKNWEKVKTLLGSREEDAQIIFWGPNEDIKTALETIEERCIMAFFGVPNETRKALDDYTTIFERVLPGADRMYPDTDSAPIPLEDSAIEKISQTLPADIFKRIEQLKQWLVPIDAYTYILKKNLSPLMERINESTGISHKFIATLLAHRLKRIEGQFPRLPEFTYEKVEELLQFIVRKKLDPAIARKMLPVLYQHPKMDPESILVSMGFIEIPKSEIEGKLPFLIKKYSQIRISSDNDAGKRWIMGSLHKTAIGNVNLKELSEKIQF
ncbi:MAG: Glu-tRNA(Gln) amidotransferase subunit GatE [Bacteroidota bacterium]